MENITISQQYDDRQYNEDVYYAAFSRLAAFFGRNVPSHWHDSCFQLHHLTSGEIELQLDDRHYALQAPLFILTPPTVPHAFISEKESDGHVLIVHQELIWPLMQTLWPGSREALEIPGFCLPLEAGSETQRALEGLWPLLASEFRHQQNGRDTQLRLLAQSVFMMLLREMERGKGANVSVRGEMKLLRRFNQMVNETYRQHLTLPDYARELDISESRLNELCRRLANQSPKRLIHERLLREAKRLLLFSDSSVHQISSALGYKDPAYFARFFHRLAGFSPSEFRRRWNLLRH